MYRRNIEEVMAELRTAPQGLGTGEARARLAQYGPNELVEKKGKTPLLMFLDQFKDFMILVLIAAAVISGLIGELSDTIAIIVIVFLNATVGFVQQYRAERAMAALKKMAAPSAVVMRNGMPETTSVSELVPGDMVMFEAGKIIPADMRLREAVHLKVDEAALTGESVPVEKNTGELHEEHTALGDRKNMAYKGTLVTSGRGVGMVVATGMNTELGRIAAMLQEEDEVQTPLQKRLAVFGQKLAVAVLALCALVLAMGIMRGVPPLLMFLTAISLAVAAIPEALPAVITISLALGAKKLSKLHALIRKLPAVETLGSVTYICSDKTGTLTLNKMTVEEIYLDGALARSAEGNVRQATARTSLSPARHLFPALALSNDAQVGADGAVLGDPTEIALYEAAKKQGFEKKDRERSSPRLAEIPFDSERKCMTTFHARPGGGIVSYTKGAIDVLINKAGHTLTADGLRSVDREELYRANERMAAAGLRVLCIAMRTWDALPDDMSAGNVETGLTVLGLVGMMDPPRAEAREAVALCKAAGIKAVMITGDHPATARTIAG